MGKMKQRMEVKCELAMMGKVVECRNDEVQAMTEYIFSAMDKDPSKLVNILEDTIRKYNEDNNVKYLVCNKIYDMPCITYLLESSSEDEEERYPAPFKEDYGSGYPSAFCFVFNTDNDWCSEFGDCFFELKADGFYHRVS